ncbi:MAG: hypothetical protein ACKPJJ_18635, partial [Planctomycetaceae bacterium]
RKNIRGTTSLLRVRSNIPLFAPHAIIRSNPCSSVAEKTARKNIRGTTSLLRAKPKQIKQRICRIQKT